MKSIDLGRGYVALVSDEDYDVVSDRKWRALVQGSQETPRVYAVSGTLRLHRVIWERANGPIPAGAEIDHREPGIHGGLDNRRSNLRLCDKSLNQANSRIGRNNTSGFKGVWWASHARMWRVDIWVKRTKHFCGYFKDKEAAALAYDRAALMYFGEHARLNFPRRAA